MNDAMPIGTDLLVLAGHTAAGKPTLAAHLAKVLGGEIISADSRQVYRGMDLGTGKDLVDYRIGDFTVPYHLIDILPAGQRYSLYDFQRDFQTVYQDIHSRGKLPLLCGGTGLYTESVLKGYFLPDAPVDPEFRLSLAKQSDGELTELLKSMVPLHNQSDTTDRERLLRALEIARNAPFREHPVASVFPMKAQVFILFFDAESRRKRITERLSQRLESGMIEEVQALLKTVKPEDLMYYGLEYKYLTLYCIGKISYEEMFNSLNTAIHQFAKRQMTWFRGMERRGIPVHWIPGELPLNEKLDLILTS